jgi:hypothetical protein
VPLQAPRIGVARDDPAVVRRVRAEEEAAERDRQREEKEMRELHSGVANRRALAGVGPAGVDADRAGRTGSRSVALSRVPPSNSGENMKPGGAKRRAGGSAPHEAWIAADPFKGGLRVLITGPHGFERTVTFAIDDDPAVIAQRVTGTTAAPVGGCTGGRKAEELSSIWLGPHYEQFR